ncbi:MAG: hypothetical protein COT89_01415 [Candidatus Colwellbacteria bacterium CG10_big_fil_rev_8_21_14_0_10_42_22]|uniref:Phosphoribosyltransferase domain-containing protein n=1 Tax=Candidatus Colwellbacteria bacterium CG10_big_fil_rev_8_21_14_0_10_42_22 TaxID=1974540 RepID=A0A2H0VG68_9BACT|nr:MAG: hypothetical protein COT89_01415 [Candidatus Colwellbacteria bacterium CG10_big_fil_rev_8_21_14_0_10_42_22]
MPVKVWEQLLDILFPSVCLECGVYLENSLSRENLLCEKCFGDIFIFKNAFHLPGGNRFYAVGSYTSRPLQKLIHHLKYGGHQNAMPTIERIIEVYLDIFSDELQKQTILIPIPLHKNRLRKRGFNQSLLIAKVLSKKLKLPISGELLSRPKNTRRQTEIKNNKGREQNVANCFRVNRKLDLKGSILLVDDVYTTGATINEALKTLRRAGMRDISVFVLAKAG